MRAPIDWDSPTWGQPGHNVHVSATGSWLESTETTEDYR